MPATASKDKIIPVLDRKNFIGFKTEPLKTRVAQKHYIAGGKIGNFFTVTVITSCLIGIVAQNAYYAPVSHFIYQAIFQNRFQLMPELKVGHINGSKLVNEREKSKQILCYLDSC